VNSSKKGERDLNTTASRQRCMAVVSLMAVVLVACTPWVGGGGGEVFGPPDAESDIFPLTIPRADPAFHKPTDFGVAIEYAFAGGKQMKVTAAMSTQRLVDAEWVFKAGYSSIETDYQTPGSVGYYAASPRIFHGEGRYRVRAVGTHCTFRDGTPCFLDSGAGTRPESYYGFIVDNDAPGGAAVLERGRETP